MRNVWEFASTQRIVFGPGSINQLTEIVAELHAKSVFIITDPGIKKAGILDKVTAALDGSDLKIEIFADAQAEPSIEVALGCYEFAKSKLDTDVIIGLGGGSAIDLAKVTALLMAHGGNPRDYFGEFKVPGPVAPMIAIPTTAGTGSEVTSVAVVTDTENQLKVGISDNYLRPTVALLDPELTVGLPPYVTACTGIDALSHAIEAYTAKPFSSVAATGKILFQGSQPVSDALAIQAIELIAENLVLAVRQGTNLEARSNMLLASMLAGMAFSNAGTALSHALGYPIGGLVHSPHGEVTGLMMPYVMDFNASVVPDKMIKIAQAFGVQTTQMSKHDAAKSAGEAILQLLKDIGLPTNLNQIGIKEENLDEIGRKTLGIERLVRNNPRVPTEKDLIELVRKAY
ncbi:iron-containing alcohol dehydrogenase [Paenibacillus sp. BSR1-1]|uniref:hydroxyacid-oxoacid transhydrogenase n=1 Tax=Paenibacillus sp. BSR1-1 TaxID=3020845 RepID=UPI0025AEE400|nr:hydroxyacid-oxoacid transhydrogenase [Paenibacillus sp. BSR1-1]MDN3017971.1 iron-containing alcohol dehydrogenase [Paenibacillus sp. BSR1-1]